MNKLIHNALFSISAIFVSLVTIVSVLYCCSVLKVKISFTVILNMGIFLVIAIGFLYIVSLMISIYITNKTVKHIEKSVKELEIHPESICSLDNDLSVIFNIITEQNSKISYFRGLVKTQKEQIEMIMYNMREGLVVLLEDFTIQLINNGAKSMLSPNYRHREGRKLIEFTREEKILESVQKAKVTGEYQKIMIKTQEEKYYKVYVNPVPNKGFILLIVDVTKEKLSLTVKKDFSANVSHELKTPLTIINGFAELMANGMVTDEESVKKHASLIQKEGTRLLNLIEDIMHLSKIESGSNLPKDANVELFEVAKAVVERLSLLAESKNITMKLSGTKCSIMANKSFIDELLSNLIENAIKYNKPNGTINVLIKDKIITVSDTGIGIPKEDLPRIFERFYRVDKSRSKQSGGTGLGLSIIKNITELYNGKLDIKSTLTKGTTITIDFN